MLIRNAIVGEEQAVVAFYETLIRKLAKHNYKLPWQVGVYPTAAQLEDAVTRQSMYLCLEDDRILGAAILNGVQGDGYAEAPWQCNVSDDQVSVIHLLCTDPDLHGRGIGAALVNHLIAEARSQGKKSLRLDVLHTNKPAARLYENAGFSKRREVTLFYPTTGTTQFWLYEFVL